MLRTIFVTFGITSLLVAGCAAASPLQGPYTLPNNVAKDCRSLCQEADLQMSSVVVMANSVGCVCVPPGTTARNDGEAAAAGAITVALHDTDVDSLRMRRRMH